MKMYITKLSTGLWENLNLETISPKFLLFINLDPKAVWRPNRFWFPTQISFFIICLIFELLILEGFEDLCFQNYRGT